MTRTCAKCGNPLPPPKAGGQRRFCTTCSPPRPDRAKVAEVVPLRSSGAVYDATLRAVTEAGLTNHWRGHLLLTLAENIDGHAAGEGSAAGLVALVREFQSTFAKAVPRQPQTHSALDELRRRRERKSR